MKLSINDTTDKGKDTVMKARHNDKGESVTQGYVSRKEGDARLPVPTENT